MVANSPTPHGRTEAEWERLTDAGLRFLLEQARMERTTTYTELDSVLHRRTGCGGSTSLSTSTALRWGTYSDSSWIESDRSPGT